jgi:AmmeMemoRadiSam system protein B
MSTELPETKFAALPPLKVGIEAIQIEHEGKPAVLLRDQEGLNEQSMAITMPAFMIAMMLDGNSTVADIQSNFSKTTGQLIKPEEINGLVKALEKADLLETPSLQEKRRRTYQEFVDSPVRKPAHARGGYPADRLELATFLGKFFQDPKGPNKQMSSAPTKPAPLGLFSPHIDFHRGGPAYAWTYQALSECERPDVIVALGVAHMSPNSPWVFTNKSYETPYGPVPVAAGVYKDLQSCLWYDVAVDQSVHRTEHSLEFQALWLKYLWRDNTPPWVPILCSSFDPFCSDRAPSTIASIENAINAMGAALKARQDKGEKVMILAGVDLAHVGPRFGDELKLGAELEARVEKEDRVALDLALKGDADAMYLAVVADGHWRKWCGLSAIYTALRLMKILSPAGSIHGELLTYAQAPDPAGGLVSFTGALFPR